MKKYSFLLTGLLQLFVIASKAQNECGSVFNPQTIQTLDPNRYNRYIQLEQHIANYIASLNGNGSESLINPNSTIIIPVVVHVLHNGEPIGVGNNIADVQIQSQIDVLNEDFRRLNADRVNTPAAFTGVAADPNFEFRLACIDPNGNATNGIHRVQTNITAFTVQFNNNGSVNEQATRIKFTAQGGTDAWATDRYLNMWVCNIAPSPNGQLLGYAQFPFDFATSPNTDGVVMLNTAFGRVGNLRFQYDQGRTTTHEVGHWLNLFHIWGDDGTACTGSDQCDDTPNQGGANQSNCPGFPQVSCNNGPNGDMFMNYMDYTIDGCKNIYTQGQTNRMRAVFANGGPRAAFINNYFRLNDPTTNAVCTNTTISAVNPMCLPITWSISGPATITPAGNSAIVTRNGDGTVTVTATAGGYFDSKTIYVGVPAPPTIVGLNYDRWCGTYVEAGCTHPAGATNYIWDLNYGQVTGEGDYFYQAPLVYNPMVGFTYYNYLSVRAQNACGTSDPTTVSLTVGPVPARCGGGMQLMLSPNPTTGMLTVQTTDNSEFTKLFIVDKLGQLRKQFTYAASKKVTINVSDLPADIYLVRALINNTLVTVSFIKQ